MTAVTPARSATFDSVWKSAGELTSRVEEQGPLGLPEKRNLGARRKEMTTKRALILGLVLLFGTTALAQDYAKVQVPVGYSYMRFNPENSNIVSGFSLNGGGGGITVFLNHAFGISAEFDGYSSNNAFDFVIGGGIDIPVTHSLAIRPPQFDYVLTRFGNAFTKGNQNQSNFRYQAGIVFRL
jgi:hypothetical protein